LIEGTGLPVSAGVSAAHTADIEALDPLVAAIPAVRSARGPRRRRPDKLYADKAYDAGWARALLRERGITPRIARRGIESSQRLGRHRWRVEASIAWLGNFRRLAQRWERHPSLFLGFLGLACALICFRRLRQVTG
jgi:transposase